jgi:NAD(P)-dependent dehydrogenase (short-subunit alcohol dehydrogenase family)
MSGTHIPGRSIRLVSITATAVFKINLVHLLSNSNIRLKLGNLNRSIVTSEVASFDPLPFNGLYNVSKTALDAYAQALRQELGLIGQKVITIRPGAVETPLQNSSLSATEQLATTTKLYKKQSKHFLFFVKHFMGKPMKAEKMAEKIARIHRKRHP